MDTLMNKFNVDVDILNYWPHRVTWTSSHNGSPHRLRILDPRAAEHLDTELSMQLSYMNSKSKV